VKLREPRVWIAMLSTVAVVAFGLTKIGRKAPGELSTVHGREAALQGNSCSECHGGWFSDMRESCLVCHEEIAKDIADEHGLHGSLGAQKARLCSLCHSEHNGPGFALVNRQSFAAAGVADPSKFDHYRIGFDMRGKHLGLECTKCHENAVKPLLDKGTHRYIGLSKDCSTCHEDAHKGRMKIGCAMCHGQNAFDVLEAIGHDRHLALIGGHGNLECTRCHQKSSKHSLDALGGGRMPEPRACMDCHESPHSDTFVLGVAAMSDKTAAESCGICHLDVYDSFREKQTTVTVEQHARSGFALTPPHDKVECTKCHPPHESEFAKRYPGRKADDCASCHESPHGRQFETGPFAGRGCVACHSRAGFTPHAFTLDKHAESSFPLTGRHEDVDCGKCHTVHDGMRVFRGTISKCAGCHADAHRGAFDRFSAQLENGCGTCHSTSSFSETHDFDHGRWTGFAIRGAHAQSDCSVCHRAGDPDEHGRTLGFVTDEYPKAKQAGNTCLACHTDPHRGSFDEPGLPRTVDGRRGCVRCHSESSFRDLPHGFDHARFTGFELRGAHFELACSACHAPLRPPDALGRTWARATGRKCVDCHNDPHAGQFEVKGVTDCSRCHGSLDFKKLHFDHDKDSRFVLGDAHRKVACANCHRTTSIATHDVVRYRPLPHQCVDCHGQHKDPLRRRRGG